MLVHFEVTVPMLKFRENKVSTKGVPYVSETDFSAQAFYNDSQGRYGRGKMMKAAKAHIAACIKAAGAPTEGFDPKSELVLVVEINAKDRDYDTSNTAFAWDKAFLDAVKRVSPIVKSGPNRGKVKVRGERVQYLGVPLIETDNCKQVGPTVYIPTTKRDDTVKFTLMADYGRRVIGTALSQARIMKDHQQKLQQKAKGNGNDLGNTLRD